MSDTEEKTQYISREEFDRLAKGTLLTEDAQTFHTLANRESGTLRVPRAKGVNRKQVVQAFQSAFELIGGVPRLATWANENETDFYRLYAKLLPSQNSEAMGEKNEMVIKHVLPRGKLDD